MKRVTEIKATMITFDCPNCGVNQEGFLDDPRGGKFICEECREEYLVEETAGVILS